MNPEAPKLKHLGKPFATDSITMSIVRLENGRQVQITCADPAFDNRVCYTVDEDVKHRQELIDLSWKCEKWRP